VVEFHADVLTGGMYRYGTVVVGTYLGYTIVWGIYFTKPTLSNTIERVHD